MNAEQIERNETLRSEIREKIKAIRSYTPKVGVFGNSGVGKSSLCNALFGKDVAKISDVEACTRKPQEIFIQSGEKNQGIKLIDLPGIGEDPEHQIEYTNLYKSIAPELDLILWSIKADDRNYASSLDAYNAVLSTEKTPPVLFVVTQTDKTNDTEDWDHNQYIPGETQINNITLKENDISRRFNIPTNKIISVAVSKKGKTYNLKKLVDLVVEILPNEKKFSITREAKEENVSDESKESAEKGVWQSIKDFFGDLWEVAKPIAIEEIISSAPKFAKKALDFLKKIFL